MTFDLYASAGILLEQRQVLERGGVEHDVRAALLEDLDHAVGVADVGEDRVGRVEQRPTVDRQLHLVERALVAVEHDQLGGREAVELPAQLAADAAAGAGDEDASAGEVVGDRVDVGVDLMAAEQVLLGEVADVADADRARASRAPGGAP